MLPAEKTNTKAPQRAPESFAAFLYSWRYFLWFLGIILIVVGLLAEENWRGEWAWTRYKRKMAEAGQPIELSAVVPPRVPDDQNFAMTPFLAPLFGFPSGQGWGGKRATFGVSSFATNYDAASRELESEKGNQFSSWLRSRTDLPAWAVAFKISKAKAGKQATIYKPAGKGARFQFPTNETALTSSGFFKTNYTVSEAANAVLEMLSDSQPIFDELQAASKLPCCRFDLNYEHDDPAGILLPHLSVVKRLCLLLQLRASAELALNQTEKAYQDIRLSLYLAECLQKEPFIVSQFVRFSSLLFAFQSFAEGIDQWSVPQLKDFQREFARFNFCADATRTLSAERVWNTMIIDYVANVPAKLDVLNNFMGGQPAAGFALGAVLMSVAPSGWFDFEKLNCCRMIDEDVLPGIDAKTHRISPRLNNAAKRRLETTTGHSLPRLYFRHYFFAKLLVPGNSGMAQKAALLQAGVDCAGIACALELYRRDHGEFPQTLEDLVPRFIQNLPADIINREPLKYRRDKESNYSLYSVGWNEIDDGGIVVHVRAPGEVAVPEGDWVWRLPPKAGE